jgi:methylmalonyl-CoA mutase N-terminal domain/subunit
MGGSVQAIEAGWIQDEIHESAFRIQNAVESGDRAVIGVNRYAASDDEALDIQTIDESGVEAQKERVRELRASRDQRAVDAALALVTETARGTANLLPPIKEALRSRATLGEVSDALRAVFGEYHANR